MSRNNHLLARAVAEAERGEWLFTAPNPRVGAIALKDGHVVGRGYHALWRGPHAEEAALRDAGAFNPDNGEVVSGVVDEMVVTLEPCSARGGVKKRPACCELLVAAGVRKLLVGAIDPDTRHESAGLEQLALDGVEVELDGSFEEKFTSLNSAFLRANSYSSRPWILHKWASTFDGKTACNSGASKWISGPESRAEAHLLRASMDAILCGPRTFKMDNPSLTARPGGVDAELQPLRVFITDGRPLSAELNALSSPAECLWVCAAEGIDDPVLAKRLEAGDRQLRLPEDDSGRVDLAALCASLYADFGVRRLLVEGGAQIQGAMVDLGLVDAVVRYEGPILFGGGHGAALGTGVTSPDEAIRLGHEERADLGNDLRRAFLVID